jgi:hypothetical protein
MVALVNFKSCIFLKNTEDINNPGDRDNMNAVLEVSILANRDIYQWLKREEFGMCEALKDLMKDEIDEAVTEAVTQAVTENDKKNAAETEKKVISLIEALMSSSHIDADKAMELLQIPTGERMGLKQKIEASELQRA